MTELHPRRYVFRGHSSGVAAHIRRPDKHLVPVQGCSALPPTGGHHEEKVDAKKHGLVSHGPITTTAYGDYVDPQTGVDTTFGKVAFDAAPTETRVTSSVQDLEILGRVHVGLAKMGLAAYSSEGKDQPVIRPEGCDLKDVRIDNYLLEITLAEDFYQECDTLKKLAAKHANGMPDDQKCLFLDGGATYSPIPEANGVVRCTIVKKIDWVGDPHPRAQIDGNVVHVDDFGKIYFGEMFISGHNRRLTMVRFQLGSPHGGEVMAADGEVPGGTIPPI